VRTVRTGPKIGLTAQVALLAVLASTVGLSAAGWLVGIACGVLTNGLLARGLERSGAVGLGPANRITLVRATIVGGVAAMVADGFVRPAHVAALVVIAAVALGLDAVDGWVARHTRTASVLGARFDMEVDAFLILALSVYVGRSVGPWVLAIGAARYLFVASGWLLPWLRTPTPPRYWCKVVAAIQGIVLTIGVAGMLPVPAIDAVLVAALALLVESFGHDVWWLHRFARVPARPSFQHRRVAHAPVA
jgi:phosphatidylglycerophosphate synthase